MKTFLGKNVIITGASSGIGEALAKAFAAQGANLVLAARNLNKLQDLENELQQNGIKVLSVQCDVTQENDCINLINKSIQEFETLDILINNAGISMRGSFAQTETDVLKKVMDTNYWGTLYCSKAALPYLVKSIGSLVAVSSVTGFKGLPGRSAYASSKFAIHGLYESIRMEYLHKGLNVLIACPGFTSTNIRFNALDENGNAQSESPMNEKKMTTPEEVANDILQAIRYRKDFMLTDKQGRLIKLLNFLAPKFLEKTIHKEIAREPNSPILK
ncbi:MAG: hypothetical protein RLZZ337_1073 [Bacteroidota bacterium]